MEMKEEEKEQQDKLFLQFKPTTEHPKRMAKKLGQSEKIGQLLFPNVVFQEYLTFGYFLSLLSAIQTFLLFSFSDQKCFFL